MSDAATGDQSDGARQLLPRRARARHRLRDEGLPRGGAEAVSDERTVACEERPPPSCDRFVPVIKERKCRWLHQRYDRRSLRPLRAKVASPPANSPLDCERLPYWRAIAFPGEHFLLEETCDHRRGDHGVFDCGHSRGWGPGPEEVSEEGREVRAGPDHPSRCVQRGERYPHAAPGAGSGSLRVSPRHLSPKDLQMGVDRIPGSPLYPAGRGAAGLIRAGRRYFSTIRSTCVACQAQWVVPPFALKPPPPLNLGRSAGRAGPRRRRLGKSTRAARRRPAEWRT